MIECTQIIKTHPYIRVFFDSEKVSRIVVEQLLTKEKFSFASILPLELLRMCSDGLTVRKVHEQFATRGISEEDVDKLITILIDNHILIHEYDKNSMELSKDWPNYGWQDALDYYLAIYNYPFLSYEEPDCYIRDQEWMKIYKEEKLPPSVYKEYNSDDTVSLLKDIHALDRYNIFDLISANESFSENKISQLERLSHLFLFTFGKFGKVSFPNQGDYLLKTSPSGGARHPTEAYLYVIDPEIIGNQTSSGLFHYSVRNHTLDRLPSNFSSKEILEAAFELQIGPKFPIKAILILSSMVERSMWRYREPRSYRVILNDIGHLLETLRIVATAVGIKTYSAHGYRDSKIENFLGVDSIKEPVMRIVGLG